MPKSRKVTDAPPFRLGPAFRRGVENGLYPAFARRCSVCKRVHGCKCKKS